MPRPTEGPPPDDELDLAPDVPDVDVPQDVDDVADVVTDEATLAATDPEEDGELAAAADAPRARTNGENVRARSAELFALMGGHADGTAEHATHREALVHLHLPLVEHCARRFRNRGEPLEDLVQVGTIGLLKAIDRFEPERGIEFATYATPTVIGEIKRHFRDKGWAIRVPRRLQELRMQLTSTTADLSQKLGRSPTPSELAEAIGCTVEEVVEGLASSNAYSTLSLDAGDDTDDGAPALANQLGVEDENLEHVEIRESLKPVLEQLGARERKIVLLRFFRNMTQSQIAAEVGISQMHVSRLLSRTLEQMRRSMQE